MFTCKNIINKNLQKKRTQSEYLVFGDCEDILQNMPAMDNYDSVYLEEFVQRFNRRYQTSVRQLRPRKHSFVLSLARLAACLVLVAFLFFATEFIAVNAFGFSIVQSICDWGDSVQKYVDKVSGDDVR